MLATSVRCVISSKFVAKSLIILFHDLQLLILGQMAILIPENSEIAWNETSNGMAAFACFFQDFLASRYLFCSTQKQIYVAKMTKFLIETQ